MARDLTWQPSLLDGSVVELDRSFHGGRRHPLGEDAWVDHVPGWCRGADLLFAELLQNTPWRDREVRMYDRVVPEPRLTHRWHLDRGPDPVGAENRVTVFDQRLLHQPTSRSGSAARAA
jgi:hypothetical protein